jgi:hypothetical protein
MKEVKLYEIIIHMPIYSIHRLHLVRDICNQRYRNEPLSDIGLKSEQFVGHSYMAQRYPTLSF